jgi:hypothetical protein
VRPEKPHRLVIGNLLKRIDEYAKGRDELALVIADEVEGQSSYRQDPWTFQRYAARGYRARRVTRVVDTMHFVPSHASRLVQAADLVAFMYRRRATVRESDERARRANEALWLRVESRVYHSCERVDEGLKEKLALVGRDERRLADHPVTRVAAHAQHQEVGGDLLPSGLRSRIPGAPAQGSR